MTDPLSEAENGPEKLFEKKSVGSFLWKGLNVKMKDRETRDFRTILSGVDGMVKEGADHGCYGTLVGASARHTTVS